LGDFVLHARVDDGTIDAAAGPLPEPDLVIETQESIKPLMTGEISVAEAVAGERVHLTGDTALFGRFAEIFRITPMPA
jgi:hypothetical protein